MKIASHPAIADARPGSHLPTSWTVLAKLASLSAADFENAQERGLISANTSKRKAVAINAAYKTPTGGAVGEGTSTLGLPSPQEAKVSTNTITRFERGDPLKERTLDAIRVALESAGVEFTNGDQPGVRLKPRG